MSATSAPFGLRPAFHPSGLDRAQALAGGITSGYATQILKGQPVAYSASAGVIVPVTANSTNAAWSGALQVYSGQILLDVLVCLTIGLQTLLTQQVLAQLTSTTTKTSFMKSKLMVQWLRPQLVTNICSPT